MSSARHFGSLATLCAAGCAFVAAQGGPPLTSEYSPGAIPSGAGMHIETYPAVTGHPFRAENNSRRTEIRPGGRQVMYEYHGVVARDSRGRVYSGTNSSPRASTGNGRSVIFIRGGGSVTDPTTKVLLRWDEMSKTVTKTALLSAQIPLAPQPLDACQRENGKTRSYPNGETQRVESLEDRVIQRIPARGCRVSTLVPAGILHNDQPLVITDDSWSSPELRITLLRIHHDPSGNDEITQLDNISTAEPDAQLFQPPPEYALRDPEADELKREAAQPPISHPELLAGLWESEPDSSGVVDGIHVQLNTASRESVEHLSMFEVAVYRRQGQAMKRNTFTANDGGGATWDGTRLNIKFLPKVAGEVSLDLNLIFDPGQSIWDGTIARNGVSKAVRLKHPGGFAGPSSNPFVGEWYLHLDRSRPLPPGVFRDSYCLHITQATDGSLVAWQDHKGPVINPYGSKLKVVAVEGNSMTLTNKTDEYFGGNELRYFVTLSPDGTRLEMKSSTNGAPYLPLVRILLKGTGEGFITPP